MAGSKGETMLTVAEVMEDTGVIEEGAVVLVGGAEAEGEGHDYSRLDHGNLTLVARCMLYRALRLNASPRRQSVL